MIKINLIPVKEKKKRTELLMIFAIGAVAILLMMAMGAYYLQKKNVVKSLDNEIAQITEESKAYEEKIKEIKELEAKEASLATFKSTIKGIAEVQRKVVVAVDQLALGLPDGVWLTNLSQRNGAEANKFVVQGYAFTQLGLRTYLEALQRPGELLGDATLDIRSITSNVGANKQVHQFELTAKVMESSK